MKSTTLVNWVMLGIGSIVAFTILWSKGYDTMAWIFVGVASLSALEAIYGVTFGYEKLSG